MATLELLAQDWLSNEDWWFSPAVDLYLTDKYMHLLDAPAPTKPTLGTIILYDQLPRHFFRHQPAAHVISYFLSKALDARAAIKAPSTIRETIFYQLPLRHTNDPELIHEVMSDAWQRFETFSPTTDPDYPMFRRFLKA